MAKLHIDAQYVSQSATNSYPAIDRFNAATNPIPVNGTDLKSAIVTDGTFAPTTGQGSAYVGGGSLLNVVWWNGFAWITV